MTDAAVSRQCQVCKGYDCQASNHRRCSLCQSRGHTKRTCTEEKEEDYVMEENLNLDSDDSTSETEGHYSIPLRRDSTRQLTQFIVNVIIIFNHKEEVDMAARILVGCQIEKAQHLPPESAMDRSELQRKDAQQSVMVGLACRLSGIGRSRMTTIKTALDAGQRPMAVEPKRGKWPRSYSRNLLTKINKTIEALHKAGVMSTTRKIAKNLDFYDGIQLSHSTLCRILKKMGYAYKQVGPSNTLLAHESQEMAQYRLDYLRAVKAAREHQEIVYLDETYVNCSHQANKCWVSTESQVYKPSGKGRRYIIYGAGSRNGWVGSPVIFPYKGDHKDYHHGMNADHFEELFTDTCKEAKEKLGPCAIVLDNASYHKRLTSEKDRLGYWLNTPAKEVLQSWEKNEVPGQEKYKGPPVKYKKQIIDFLRSNRPTGVCKVKKIANEFGHDILLLPPYRPELNAIEVAWGVLKNRTARENTPQHTFADLKSIIEAAVKTVTLETWAKLDAKTMTEEVRQLDQLQCEESRREEFRRQHPDLIFSLDDGEESDSDEEDDAAAEILENLTDGLNEVDSIEGENRMDNVRGGVLPEERDAVDALMILRGQPNHTEE